MNKLLLLLSLLYTQQLFAQTQTWEISGKVVDEAQKPIEFVNVYANNMSIGTSTNSKGEFTLKISNKIPKIELIASFVGYSRFKLAVSQETNEILDIHLKSSVLKEVKVSVKRDRFFKKKWQIFEDGLLGKSEFTKNCTILNPEVIRLEYDTYWNVLASADDYFYVQNNDLGYKIKILLKYFSSDGGITTIAADKYFEKMKPANAEQEELWEKNRKKAYKNSFRNFLISLIHDDLEKEGFEVFQVHFINRTYFKRMSLSEQTADKKAIPCSASDIFFYDDKKEEYVLHSNLPLLIYLKDYKDFAPIFREYPYKFAIVLLPYTSISFTENGWLTKPNDIQLREMWGFEGYSILLPDDYGLN